eukprot:sb/3478375/
MSRSISLCLPTYFNHFIFLSPSLESLYQLRVASQAEIPVCVADTGLTGDVAAEFELTITLFNHLYHLCSVTPSTAKILTAIPPENDEMLAIRIPESTETSN